MGKKTEKPRKYEVGKGGAEGKSELDEWDLGFNGGGAVVELLQTFKEEKKKTKHQAPTADDGEPLELSSPFPKWGRVQQILEKRSAGSGGGGGEPSKAPLKYVPLDARDASRLKKRLKEACNSKACKHFFVGVGCKRGAACKFEHTLHAGSDSEAEISQREDGGSPSNDSDMPAPLAGGYERGDRVKAKVEVAARKVRVGDVGTVMGPANNPKAKEAAEKVCVDFGVGKGLLNLKAETQIERVGAVEEGGGGGGGAEEDGDAAAGGKKRGREGGGEGGDRKKKLTRKEERREQGRLKASKKA